MTFTIPKTATPLEVCHALDRYIKSHLPGCYTLTESNTGMRLWNILSALRGPDSEDGPSKWATIHVRALTFPLSGERLSYPWLKEGQAAGTEAAYDAMHSSSSRDEGHFMNHTRRACRALDVEATP